MNKINENNVRYPVCPLCKCNTIAAAHMTSDDSRSIYCVNDSCDYYVKFDELTTPVKEKRYRLK